MKKSTISLLVVGALAAAGWGWLSTANNYQADGEFKVMGLQESVRVVRDEKGMPYIYANNHLDATMAQGFVSAQDRLFQMELTRRAISGRLSEVLGESTKATDIRNRTIGMYRIAQQHAEMLNEQELDYLQHYVDGINAYIDTKQDEFPLKLKLLGVEVEHWTPADALAIAYLIGWGGSANLRTEMIAQALMDKLGSELANEIFPLNINPDDADKAQPVSVAQSNTSQQALGLLDNQQLVGYMQPGKLRLGSNNWAMAPQFSSNAMPIVVSDPHLDARTLPGPIYPMGIITPQYRVVGAAFAGMPTLVIGRNQYVATGLTNGYGDTQDLYIETLDPNDDNRYMEGDQSFAFDVRVEKLKIKDKLQDSGFRIEHIEIKSTHRGPIVSDAIKGLAGDHLMSLRWAMSEGMSENLSLGGLLFAKSVDDVKAVLKDWTMISGNWAFADVQGNIGFHASGKVPIRSQGESILPYRVTDSIDNWIGWIPFEQMPSSYNPSRGWVGSANHKVDSEESPYYYSSYFSPSYRYQRMRELLNTPEQKSVDQHWQMQRDTKNMLALTMVPIMVAALQDNEQTKQFAQILADWNLHDDVELAAPVIFHSVMDEFAKLVYRDELGKELSGSMLKVNYFWQERLEHLVIDDNSRWFDDVTTEPVIESRDDILVQAAALAKDKISKILGDSPADWQWGKVHTIEFTSPVRRKGVGKGLLGAGKYPFPGSTETLHRGIYSFDKGFSTTTSASMRMVADLSDNDKVLSVLPGGESGRLFDAHRNDQTKAFVEGDKRYWWFSDKALAENTVSELTLIP